MARFLVLDVESVGLHGEGFAVGAVAYDTVTRETIPYGLVSCPPDRAAGSDGGRLWVKDHCHFKALVEEPRNVRNWFWSIWIDEKKKGSLLVADVCWPVEANFLSACIRDDPARQWDGPFPPLLDISSILLAAGMDPLFSPERMVWEQPEHDPLRDAIHSLRKLQAALAKLEEKP